MLLRNGVLMLDLRRPYLPLSRTFCSTRSNRGRAHAQQSFPDLCVQLHVSAPLHRLNQAGKDLSQRLTADAVGRFHTIVNASRTASSYTRHRCRGC